ncbi:MAG: MFS transporter [Sphaerochaeta sp.]|nr:MAG: MFS transporter [Sphaerochaeta sp.]HOE89618.1 MFS transporter [Sphaerochaeta sp.]
MLTRRVKFGFGIGDLGGNLFFTIIGFYLLFYFTDIVGLNPALSGTAVMIGKVWDAITDPITGYYSDRTKSRFGRRRPYIFIGAIFSFFFMIQLFTPVSMKNEMSLFLYYTLVYSLLNTAYTLVNIPYTALLPELTDDYHERTILTGYRMSFAVLGTFAGAALVMPILNATSWPVMGGVMGGIMLASAMITVFAIREPKEHSKPGEDGFLSTFAEVLKEKVFLQALLPWTFFITGTMMIQGGLVYYFTYIYGNKDLFQLALVGLLSFSLLCIPFWVSVSKKIGKRKVYMIGMSIVSVGVLLFTTLGAVFGPIFGIVVMSLAGIGLSTHYVMPHSILPDVVEYDAHTNKKGRREGVFSSIWTFSSKIGQAFALALNGWILAIFGYQGGSFLPQTKPGIILIVGPLPILWYILGLLILRHYPIDQAYYNEMIKRGE